MDTGSIRPVSPVAEAAPTRAAESAAAVATVMAADKVVTAASEGQTFSDDPRRDPHPDTVDVSMSPNVVKALAFDDATHLPVTRRIKNPGNIVLDQSPSEAYLRMKAALRDTLDNAARPRGSYSSRKA